MPRLKLNLYPPNINWTKTPNVILDRLMPVLKDTELRVLLALVRQTYGWHRDDRTVILSYKTLKERTGRQSAAIANALVSLTSKGLINRVGPHYRPKTKQTASKTEPQQ